MSILFYRSGNTEDPLHTTSFLNSQPISADLILRTGTELCPERLSSRLLRNIPLKERNCLDISCNGALSHFLYFYIAELVLQNDPKTSLVVNTSPVSENIKPFGFCPNPARE